MTQLNSPADNEPAWPKVAIIGGTGFMDGLELVELQRRQHSTAFGSASAPLLHLRDPGCGAEFVLLARHGSPHAVAPHLVNYQANIMALKQVGITHIIGVNAVGSIDPALQAQDIVVPHQLVDYTWGRAASFFDSRCGELKHIDFSDPFDAQLRQQIFEQAHRLAIKVHKSGVYGVTQGPRLETRAEITRMARDGCTLVGMTLMPEAALARELDIKYSSICLVVNPAAGVQDAVITMEQIIAAINSGMRSVRKLVMATCATL